MKEKICIQLSLSKREEKGVPLLKSYGTLVFKKAHHRTVGTICDNFRRKYSIEYAKLYFNEM